MTVKRRNGLDLCILWKLKISAPFSENSYRFCLYTVVQYIRKWTLDLWRLIVLRISCLAFSSMHDSTLTCSVLSFFTAVVQAYIYLAFRGFKMGHKIWNPLLLHLIFSLIKYAVIWGGYSKKYENKVSRFLISWLHIFLFFIMISTNVECLSFHSAYGYIYFLVWRKI
jgi:hypothetical protein